MTKGNNYLGSPTIQTSTANQELVPVKPPKWTVGYAIKKMSFDNKDNCTIVINNEARIFLEAGQGFESTYDDPIIYSFKIVESGIKFNFIASH